MRYQENEYKFNIGHFQYKLLLKPSHITDDKQFLYYRFGTEETPKLFEGKSYAPPPTVSPLGLKSAMILLGILTQEPGESGADFSEYTERQLTFANSDHAKELAQLVEDYFDSVEQ